MVKWNEGDNEMEWNISCKALYWHLVGIFFSPNQKIVQLLGYLNISTYTIHARSFTSRQIIGAIQNFNNLGSIFWWKKRGGKKPFATGDKNGRKKIMIKVDKEGEAVMKGWLFLNSLFAQNASIKINTSRSFFLFFWNKPVG